MDSTATNYNSLATSQTGVTCTYPVIPPSPPPPPPPPPGGGGGGGGGGGSPSPTITLAMLPHVSTQPLAFLYLSQIPYTGLELGPIGTILYWLVLIGLTLAFTYFVFFTVAPFINRRARNFGLRVLAVLNSNNTMPEPTPAVLAPVAPLITEKELPETPSGYSSYDGFRSFARKEALSIEDIVKALSRERPATAALRTAKSTPNVEPIYENVEPIAANDIHTNESASVRGFVVALLEGDRAAVFAGLRQQVRGAGSPEHLISAAVFLLDDVYRARIDGTSCDADIARMTARLSTPVLEKLIAALTTAVDSSYSLGITGAKLALTRALAVIGA
ncbi:MAG: hypothetical protein Q8O94_01300 [bacterium]|nr:hypothetical protein [bacterium]